MPVYFIRWAALKGPIKIGWAKNPKVRLAEIQNMSPVPLIILNTLDCEREQEYALHYHFAHLRLYGEWFQAKRELLQFVKNPCQVIDRRPLTPQPEPAADLPEQHRCLGFCFDLRGKALRPCTALAMEGSSYCMRCNLQNPRGMPRIYNVRKEEATNKLINKWRELGIVP